MILVLALALGVAACGASDNGGTIPLPNGSSSTTSTLPGGG
ncbi:MAG TPA: hypothetical protein VFW24_16420 [Acidimicrobiales bacterium]|nr:hypothetical protein [Acidimicrobiales bacterium]